MNQFQFNSVTYNSDIKSLKFSVLKKTRKNCISELLRKIPIIQIVKLIFFIKFLFKDVLKLFLWYGSHLEYKTKIRIVRVHSYNPDFSLVKRLKQFQQNLSHPFWAPNIRVSCLVIWNEIEWFSRNRTTLQIMTAPLFFLITIRWQITNKNCTNWMADNKSLWEITMNSKICACIWTRKGIALTSVVHIAVKKSLVGPTRSFLRKTKITWPENF